MTMISYLQGLGATHLFTLSNEGTLVSHDYGDSVDRTSISGGTYSFVTNPVSYGVTHCLRSTNSGSDGAVFTNRQDINGSGGSSSFNYTTNRRTLMLWLRQLHIWNVTCCYEQGGGVNNFAFMGGAQLTFQAADAGQDFLIAAVKTLAQAGRPILLHGVWEHNNVTPGTGNRVGVYANGVLQEWVQSSGATANFPGHSGDIVVGNSGDSLKSFNETTLASQTVEKECNWLGMFNNVSLSEAECREIYERSVLPEVLIAADTVANQQAAIDALAGNTYENVNCAIEVRQATDATDYSLTLDNITFVPNANLRDIAVKYVGPHTLTLVNANGSNAAEIATPAEQDLDGTTVLTGGGSVVIETPATLTVAGLVAGSIISIFDNEDSDEQFLGTLLAGGTVNPGTSFQYSHPGLSNQVWVQMVADGFVELELPVDLTSQDQVVTVFPVQDTLL